MRFTRDDVSQLKTWMERPTCNVNTVINDSQGIEEYKWTYNCQQQGAQFGPELSEERRKEIEQLLLQYPSVTTHIPG